MILDRPKRSSKYDKHKDQMIKDYENGVPVVEIQKKYGSGAITYIHKHVEGRRTKAKDQPDKRLGEILQMYYEGYNLREINEKVGKGSSQVLFAHLRKYGGHRKFRASEPRNQYGVTDEELEEEVKKFGYTKTSEKYGININTLHYRVGPGLSPSKQGRPQGENLWREFEILREQMDLMKKEIKELKEDK